MNVYEIITTLRRMAENSRSKHDALIASADLHEQQQARIAELEQQLANAYMDGVKKAVYEIMKEADIPGSNEIRNSGDTDDGMCAQVAERIKSQLAVSQQREQAAVDRQDELQKAFALACRMISNNFPVCLPDHQSWQDYILERVRTEPVCRVCGCTEDNACPGGCYWVEPDLCSACAQAGKGDSDA